jgi:hypothetical protein
MFKYVLQICNVDFSVYFTISLERLDKESMPGVLSFVIVSLVVRIA